MKNGWRLGFLPPLHATDGYSRSGNQHDSRRHSQAAAIVGLVHVTIALSTPVNVCYASRGTGLSQPTATIEKKSRTFAVLGSVIFLFLAPGFVAGVVPWWITGWRIQASAIGLLPVRIAGGGLILLGLPLLLSSFLGFALEGRGTPAPIFPTRSLVVSGFYRYVRNPMYVGVVSVIFGQALIFGDVRLLPYGALVWLTFHLFVLIYEEPTLCRTYGSEYEEYRAHVPRWIPRLRPWH